MPDLSAIDDHRWQEAERRAAALRPLLEPSRCSRSAMALAAVELGLSQRQTWTLLKRLRAGGGEVTSLGVNGSDGGRGGKRLPVASEGVVDTTIKECFLNPQRLPPSELVIEVRGRCRKLGLRAPSASTIRRRVANLSHTERAPRNETGPDPSPVRGPARVARHALDLVQIDHTKVDLILVDAIDRLPIGRPWITVAIDVATRMIAGFHVDLEPPTATSVGLCLLHVATDKTAWLDERGIDARWPLAGKPRAIGVDNAREFHSAAFERGCAQHGIDIDWRPPGQPHFGGIVERVIGTLMGLVHALPGTTFSSIRERSGYDSDKAACLTLAELERWVAVAIAKRYHMSAHEGLGGATPLARCEADLAASGPTIPRPRDPRAYLVDFLPVVQRSIQREGITIDYITYFAQSLVPMIAEREAGRTLIIRRDPRDLSRVFVLDEQQDAYLEVPCRDLSRPGITLWEHRLARRRLRSSAREVTEAAVFEAVEEMRSIEQTATTLTRSARRNRARGRTQPAPVEHRAPHLVSNTGEDLREPVPFDVIETW